MMTNFLPSFFLNALVTMMAELSARRKRKQGVGTLVCFVAVAVDVDVDVTNQ